MFLVEWWLCVECYYPTTPTDYPSTTRGMSVGHTVAVNINFCGYLQFLSISFVWIIMGTVRHWQPFWSTTRVRYIGQCWYFNPQWSAGQARNKASCVSNNITCWRKLHSCYMSTYKSGFLEGFRRWRGSILAHTERGSCSISEHCGISDRSEQNSSKLRHTAWYPYMGRLANLKVSLHNIFMGRSASKG